jgi:hypothetical protein
VKPFFVFESAVAKWDFKTRQLEHEKCPFGHLVIFFEVKLSVKSEVIKLTLDPAEVSSSIWIDQPILAKILDKEDPDLVIHGLDANSE